MRSGSKIALIRRLISYALRPHSISMNGATMRPVPCSAFKEPPKPETRSDISFTKSPKFLVSLGSLKSGVMLK